MANRINRRALLGLLAAAPAVSVLPQSIIAGEADRALLGAGSARGQGRRIVVLGAGLAGLTAAYVLMNNGFDVVVLEAQERSGGRVLTVREGFRNGGFAEMGAVRIFETHEYTNKYVKAFGLELVPYDEPGSQIFFLEGRRFLPPPPGRPWPLQQMTAEERDDPATFLPRYVLSGFDRLGDVFAPDWPAGFASALELDRLTLSEYMASQGASEGWRNWFFAQQGSIRRSNAAAALAQEMLAEGELTQGIKGGNDRLPAAFAAALGSRVQYECPVVRMAQAGGEVVVGYRTRFGGLREIRAWRCVCALPFAPLRRVDLDDLPLSDRKRSAIHNLKYMAAARCFFQTRSRFWKRDPLGALGGLNMVCTDTMAGRIWNTSPLQPDPSLGMVHSYMFDKEALAFASLGSGRVEAMRERCEKLLPGIGSQIVGIAHKAWQEDPWAGGGWGWTQPGELASYFQAMRRPEGRVHFAGEHTSLWIAWMNGAIESGERAAAEILDAAAA